MNILYIIVFFIVVFCAMYYFGSFLEDKEWNKGFCQKCGDCWVYFDTNSQGGDGYRCANKTCNKMIWQSYKKRKGNNNAKTE